MSEVEVRPVRGRADRRTFLDFPRSVYESDPHWVPPIRLDARRRLNPARGPFFDRGEAELFLAFRGDRPVGRVSAHVDYRYDAHHGSDTGFFGFFECRNDPAAAGVLLGAVEDWHADRGRNSIVGPLSFTIYDEIGILVHGFDSTPYVLNAHNPPYYEDLLVRSGYEKAIDWYAYRGGRRFAKALPDRLLRLTHRIRSRPDLTLEEIRPGGVRALTPVLKGMFDRAWGGSWGHTPMTDKEFRQMAFVLHPFLIPQLSFVARLKGRPIGFLVSIRDPNRAIQKTGGTLFPTGLYHILRESKRSDRFRVLMLGLEEDSRHRGYDLAMYGTVIERGLRLGLRECEMSNVSELNRPLVRILEKLSAERYKTYRIFRKRVGGASSDPRI